MRLLLLAGTNEARRIAEALLAAPGIEVVASLSGATREPQDLPVQMRIGGFGGGAQQKKYMLDNGIEAVVDATHPFAHNISRRTRKICGALGLPYLLVLRPGWTARQGDRWRFIDREADAAGHIPKGATVFLATGRQTLPGFANLAGRHVICRQIDRTEGDFPFEGGEYLIGHPPFSVEDEVRLFRKLGVDWLVVKNAGGLLSRSKLDAARLLGIPVLLINRPPPPDCDRVATVAAALDWIKAQAGT